MSEKLRVGVVGAGAVAQVAHLAAVSKLEDAELVGICDIDVPKAQALARRFKVPDVFDDIEDLLKLSKPDAVVICTPNLLHEVHTVTALSAGVHVLCERPLALDAGGVARVKQVYDSGDRVLLVGMNHRYRRDVRTIRDFMKGGELGDVHAIRAGWYIHRPGGLHTNPVMLKTSRITIWLTASNIIAVSMPTSRKVSMACPAFSRRPKSVAILTDTPIRQRQRVRYGSPRHGASFHRTEAVKNRPFHPTADLTSITHCGSPQTRLRQTQSAQCRF